MQTFIWNWVEKKWNNVCVNSICMHPCCRRCLLSYFGKQLAKNNIMLINEILEWLWVSGNALTSYLNVRRFLCIPHNYTIFFTCRACRQHVCILITKIGIRYKKIGISIYADKNFIFVNKIWTNNSAAQKSRSHRNTWWLFCLVPRVAKIMGGDLIVYVDTNCP